MPFRFILLLFFLLNSQWLAADNNVWNCEQGIDGEWVCQGGGDDSQPSSQSVPLDTAQPVEEKPPSPTPVTQPVVSTENEFKPVYHKPPGLVNRRPGWTCRNGENDTWTCSLVGPDPKGRARVVDNEGVRTGWFKPAYDFRQEDIFKTLQTQLPYDPWMNCQSGGRPMPVAAKTLRENAPMDVHADYSEVFDKEVTTFYGNVDLVRADQRIQADMASYDSVSETLDAQGNVFYREQDLALFSDSINLKLKTDEGRLRNALFIAPAGPIRGAADVVYRDSKFLSRYTEASFTSCRPGNQDWVVHAERLKMNRKTGKGAAKNAWLEFKGVPVLYTPYISFPLDDRRLSGLLVPTFGSNDKNGLDIEAPFYWNMAPNYDMTITPRYMGRRGGMLRTNFRFLTHWTKGAIDLEFVPYDRLRDKPRYGGGFKAQSQFLSGLSSTIDLNYVSDKDYFNDLNNSLGFSNTRQLRSYADIRYRPADWVNFVARAENYQTIDRSIADASKPYRKLPQIELNLQHEFENWPLALSMKNQYTYFYQDARISGQRIHLLPSVSVPWQSNSGFIKPAFSLAYTNYLLDESSPGQRKNITRVVPIASLDAGLFFERPFDLGQTRLLHTLEPRLFYLYIPKVNQADIPLFDTSLYDFNFNSLFRENRFNGPDRIQDANQVTVALTTRLMNEETGREYLKLNIGEIFYFKDREVVLSGAPETEPLSNLVAELSGQFSDHLSATSGVQWSPDSGEFTRFNGAIRYRDLPGKIVNIGYRYRRDNPLNPATIDQSDFSFKWPLLDNWFAVGRWQYSIRYGKTVESFLGLEKESCCWRFRVIGRQFLNNISNSTQATQDYAVFVQLELKGLTSFGDKVDQFLEKNLAGYRRPER